MTQDACRRERDIRGSLGYTATTTWRSFHGRHGHTAASLENRNWFQAVQAPSFCLMSAARGKYYKGDADFSRDDYKDLTSCCNALTI
ncbi:unnamed protein product [Peronospora belbahrii]|uniref:Uncharacterized protein n=1 Tax=Peronospora belbahrii TaxID=622444 RepID=A0ABN8CT30_9STRA|nr:unnamed protein product [Peronospora belbahrii]